MEGIAGCVRYSIRRMSGDVAKIYTPGLVAQSDGNPRGRGFDSPFRHHFLVEIDHEMFLRFSLPSADSGR